MSDGRWKKCIKGKKDRDEFTFYNVLIEEEKEYKRNEIEVVFKVHSSFDLAGEFCYRGDFVKKLVRCRDCKYCELINGLYFCEKVLDDYLPPMDGDRLDFFCALGEKNEN